MCVYLFIDQIVEHSFCVRSFPARDLGTCYPTLNGDKLLHLAIKPQGQRPLGRLIPLLITPLAPPSYRGLNEAFCMLFLGSKVIPVFQSSSPVQWSSPLNRDCPGYGQVYSWFCMCVKLAVNEARYARHSA